LDVGGFVVFVHFAPYLVVSVENYLIVLLNPMLFCCEPRHPFCVVCFRIPVDPMLSHQSFLQHRTTLDTSWPASTELSSELPRSLLSTRENGLCLLSSHRDHTRDVSIPFLLVRLSHTSVQFASTAPLERNIFQSPKNPGLC